MTKYDGYAFKTNSEELSVEISRRYQEIKQLKPIIKKSSQYSITKFSGKLETEQQKQLSELDLLILADDGNLCFGGECTKKGDCFIGSYNTD